MSRSPYDRLMARTTQVGECWITDYAGGASGHAHVGGQMAHRVAWEELVGPIPEGYVLDHVKERCTSKKCVNPAHLEPVTLAENSRRATVGQAHANTKPKFTCLACGATVAGGMVRAHHCQEPT